VTRSDEERFADILNAIDRCQSYEPYLRSDEFGSMAYDAVPDVPWASIAGLRNIVVHEYFRVNPELMLDIVGPGPALAAVGAWAAQRAVADGHPGRVPAR
jgi:uncharacterized protein with HEPN domain